MPAKPETKLQNAIQSRLKERGAWVTKIHGGIYSSGVPDLLVCYCGYFIALEVKTSDNKSGATKLQRAQIRAIKRAQGYGYVIRSVESAERVLDSIDRKLRQQDTTYRKGPMMDHEELLDAYDDEPVERPGLTAENERLVARVEEMEKALALAKSMILCGESMTPKSEAQIARALGERKKGHR